jgi:transcriptional regulator with XRE-family HTH domain
LKISALILANMNAEQKEILSKIKSIREKHNYSQEVMAEKMNITQSKYARFESGRTKTDLDTLHVFCSIFDMSLKDFIIYPDKLTNNEEDDIKAILQIELKKDKKEHVLKFIFGENNLEILNK